MEPDLPTALMISLRYPSFRNQLGGSDEQEAEKEEVRDKERERKNRKRDTGTVRNKVRGKIVLSTIMTERIREEEILTLS